MIGSLLYDEMSLVSPQSGVGVGRGGRLVKEEYTVGGESGVTPGSLPVWTSTPSWMKRFSIIHPWRSRRQRRIPSRHNTLSCPAFHLRIRVSIRSKETIFVTKTREFIHDNYCILVISLIFLSHSCACAFVVLSRGQESMRVIFTIIIVFVVVSTIIVVNFFIGIRCRFRDAGECKSKPFNFGFSVFLHQNVVNCNCDRPFFFVSVEFFFHTLANNIWVDATTKASSDFFPIQKLQI